MKSIGYGIVVMAGAGIYSAALFRTVDAAAFIGLGCMLFGAVLIVLDFKRP